MRSVYKNPRELATCIKDLVDLYLEDLMTYDKLEQRILKIAEANGDAVLDKDGFMPVKLSIILGDERKEIVIKIIENNQ